MSAFASKIAGYIHLWLGLLSGPIVFVVALTGAIYVFEGPLKDLFYKDRLFVTPNKQTPLPFSRLLTIAQEQLGPGHTVSRAVIDSSRNRSWMFRSLKINPEGRTYWTNYTHYDRVYLDPYTGKVLAVEDAKKEFFAIVLSMHMTLCLGETGGQAVACATLLFAAILLSGLVLWFPKKWKKAQLRQSFRIKRNAGFKRLNYDLHNVPGFYACLLMLIMSLTGLVWAFDGASSSVQFVANGFKHLPKPALPVSDTLQRQTSNALDQAVETARSRNPSAARYFVNIPPTKTGAIHITAYLDADNLYDRVQSSYDQYSGALLRTQPFGQLNNGDKLNALNYDLHTGSLVGFPTQILAFTAGLIAASLPLTGFYIWLKKKPRRKRRKV